MKKQDSNESPYTLLDKAGYTLYECTTQAEIDRFKKYYKEDEEPTFENENHYYELYNEYFQHGI